MRKQVSKHLKQGVNEKMMRFLRNIKQEVVTLRFSILTIFVTLFVVAIFTLVIINYINSTNTLLHFALKYMRESSGALEKAFADEIKKAQRDIILSRQLLEHNAISTKKISYPSELINYTVDLANQFHIVQGAYWGDENGNFIKANYEPNDTITSEVIDRNVNPPSHEYLYRDAVGKVVKEFSSLDFSYDPRKRPWYMNAKKAHEPFWSDIYQFMPSRNLGISLITPIRDEKGQFRSAFALDISLYWLSWYLSEIKISKNALIFIVNNEGKVIAFPKFYENKKEISNLSSIDLLPSKWIVKSYEIFKKTGKREFNFNYQGHTYIASYNILSQFAMHGWILGMVIPKDDFTGELKIKSVIDVGIGLLILILGIALVSSMVTQVVRPLKKLVLETDKIKRFELEDDEQVHSRITEVMFLSDAIRAMKMSLRAFKKYVPSSLVRKLIETGEGTRIGGNKKTLTVFFSDIKDFTKIAENMDPNSLMEYICEYFDEISKVIVEENGTIDKYIGDSVMAFWGAPTEVEHPNQKAARAALQCIKNITELNKKWIAENKKPMITRIGLHTGDAIVGNVGSFERINYTALGDVINLASRLEKVNKLYGTSIMVSEVLYNHLKDDYVLRKIDCVAVKGKSESGTIYELLAFNSDDLSFNIDRYRKLFEKAFAEYQHKKWDEAITGFEACLKVYPEDTVAPVFIKRCHDFKINPPKDWAGVWKMES